MERARLARDIIDTCLEMTRMGLNQGTAGNISVRYRDGMLITPTGIPYEHLTEESIVYVDAQGRHEEDKLPSSEWRFHQVVYQTRPDANAVVHNHAVNCTAVSILNRPIPAIHYMIAAAGGNSIPCAPYWRSWIPFRYSVTMKLPLFLRNLKATGCASRRNFLSGGCFYHTLVISLKQTPIYRTYHPA